jgi:hypothetical protein
LNVSAAPINAGQGLKNINQGVRQSRTQSITSFQPLPLL